MAKVTIKVRDNGPLLVSGTDVELVDAEGNPFVTEAPFALCRCGRSGKKPFCDGSHKQGFVDASRAK